MRRTAIVLTALALIGLNLTGNSAASAAGEDQSCVLMQASGEMRCYVTLREMVSVESGGRYELPASGMFTRAEVAKFNEALAAPTVAAGKSAALAPGVNAILYDAQNMPAAGTQISLVADSGCFGTTWTWNALTPSWQNRAESINTFRNCEFKIWAGQNLSGNSFGYWISATSLLGLNNDGESIQLRPR